MSPPVLRFAPSPTGALHIGHALSAVLAFEAAQRLGGRLLLRIEDIDIDRCRPEFVDAILSDLVWLGIDWEQPVRRQSEHFDDYRAAAARLAGKGLLYPCSCTRSEIAAAVAKLETPEHPWPRDPDGTPLYPGTCRPGEPVEADISQAGTGSFVLRLDMARAIELVGEPVAWVEYGDAFYDPRPDPATPALRAADDMSQWGDIVLCRKETPTSYHLSVVVDDALQGITHVTRGRDLYEATEIHRLLQRLLDLPEPVYAHHRLLVGVGGQKLSKARGDTSLRALREAGESLADIRDMIGL